MVRRKTRLIEVGGGSIRYGTSEKGWGGGQIGRALHSKQRDQGVLFGTTSKDTTIVAYVMIKPSSLFSCLESCALYTCIRVV